MANPPGISACCSAPTRQYYYFSDSAILQRPGAAKAFGAGRAADPDPHLWGRHSIPLPGSASQLVWAA